MTQVVSTPFGWFVVWAKHPITQEEALRAVVRVNPPWGLRVFPCDDQEHAQALQKVLA